MLTVKPGKGKREFTLEKISDPNQVGSEDECIVNLTLIQHSVSNKFQVVGELLGDMCKTLPGFEDWYTSMIKQYIETNCDASVLINNVGNFFIYSEAHVDSKNVNFDKFVDLKKKSNTSIVFYPEDIKSISISSTCLKLYSVFFCDGKLKLPPNIHKRMYEMLIQPCIDTDVTTKVFQLIRSRTYRSSITDKYMWDFVRLRISETPESYVMTVFNFLMKSILILINIEQNPIPFLISTIDDSIQWLMRSIYKNKVIYGEVWGGVEDLYGSALTKENFYLFCCQDVVGKGAKIGMGLIEDDDDIDTTHFDKIRDRIDNITHLYPASLLVTLPIVSNVLEVPYKFLLTIPPKHAILLGIFMHELAKDVLDKRFPFLSEFLLACPGPKKVSNNPTKSSYKIRNLELVLNDTNPLFGFGSKTLKYDIMSSITGVLSASKRVLINIVTGKQLSKMTYYSLEADVCVFFSELYSNKLNDMFEEIKEKSNAYF